MSGTSESSGWPAIDAMTEGQAAMVRFVYAQVYEVRGEGGFVLSWRGLSDWCSQRWGPGWGEGNQHAGMAICERAGADA